MHILILNSEYPPIGGGAGNASAHIARTLHEEGHQVSVLTAAYADLPKNESVEGIRIIRLPGRRLHIDRSTALEQIIFMLSASFLGFLKLLKLKPQIVLAFFGAPSGIAAWTWSFFKKIPYVVLLRGGDVPGFRPYDFGTLHRLLGPILRMVWHKAAVVVANSRGLKELGSAFEPNIPIQVIPNGVSPMEPKRKKLWRPPHLLFVGRLVYQKGLDILFAALSELQSFPWTFTIVGDGPRKKWLLAKAKEYKFNDRIRFPGWQSREQLPSFFHAANIFVYPSRHEGMPNALLEAMAAGLPSVASDIAGNEELIEHGKNGFLVPAEDPAALKEALQKLIEDQALRKKLGAAARKTAETKYTWQAVGKAYSQLIKDILAE